jgi:protein O-GlcNAc transferase
MAASDLDALFDQAADAHRHGDLARAEQLCREIIVADPRHLRALFALATIEFDRGNHLAAEGFAARVATVDASIAEAHDLRATALAALGRLDEAAASFARAAAVAQDPAAAFYNQGNILFALGRLDEALRAYDAALAHEPRDAVAHNNRGNVLRELNRPDEALTAYDRALSLDPGYADAYNNRGIAFQLIGKPEEALANFERAIVLAPNDAEVFYNRGVALTRLNRLPEALASHERALALNAEHGDAASAAFAVAAALCDWRDRARREADIAARIRAGQRLAPYVALTFSDDPALQRLAASTASSAVPHSAAPVFALSRSDARLRIAYLSSDFRNHVVGHTLVDLFESHDRERFDIWGVALSPAPDSALRRRLVASFDHFLDVSRLSDKAAAALLREQGIDIAIDLMGHTEGARPGIFAQRAAPLQVNYFGYPGTSGAAFLDYFIGDPIATPDALENHFSERIVRLPDCYLPTARMPATIAIPARRALGLPDEGFVFCDFNASQKITPTIFDIWMRLLVHVGGSVFWLYAGEAAQANLRREAERRGVSAERLVFAPPVERERHLARLAAADLFLDTVPYNAHNTATEALWAGVPLVTCTGASMAARVATSVLAAAGLATLATSSLAEYEALALSLARDPARLAALRTTLAAARRQARLFDLERYRRHLEAAFLAMWERHARGEAPASIAVSSLD